MLPTRIVVPFLNWRSPFTVPPVQRREAEMKPIKVSLCEHCSECPEVEITDQGVTIGEDENIVRLSHAEWNELVRLVKDDKLREVWKLKPSAAR